MIKSKRGMYLLLNQNSSKYPRDHQEEIVSHKFYYHRVGQK